ncbi:hypothetical protein ACTFIW_009591 [Dictyostelium discoideum]
MKLLFLVILSLISYASANLYGVWQTGNTANFGQISTTAGQATYSLLFPNFTNSLPGNSAMNDLTSIFTFQLSNNGINYLVTINVAKNKVNYFVPLPTTELVYGLRYDSDVNSLKCVVSEGNNTWLVGEIDPASGSYDVYGSVEGAFLGVGLSTWNHTYYVVTATVNDVTVTTFDTRSGENLGSVNLVLPTGVTSGPYDLLYVPSLDVLVGTVIITDSNGNSGQDYALIDPETGAVKPLGIFTAAQQVNVVSHAAHQTTLYAAVNFNAVLNFVSLDIQNAKIITQTAESTFVVSMGYFNNY